MLAVPVNAALAPQWLKFQLSDAELLQLDNGGDKISGVVVWIASLNAPRELPQLLEAIGRVAEVCAIVGYPFKGILFRTNNAHVLKWAERFELAHENKMNHRTRFLCGGSALARLAARSLERARR